MSLESVHAYVKGISTYLNILPLGSTNLMWIVRHWVSICLHANDQSQRSSQGRLGSYLLAIDKEMTNHWHTTIGKQLLTLSLWNLLPPNCLLTPFVVSMLTNKISGYFL